MGTQLTQTSKFHRKHTIDATGVLPHVNDNKLLEETKLRVSAIGVGVGNIVSIQAKLQDETTWTSLGNVTGATSVVFDVGTWDQLQFEVTTYGGSAGILIASGFISVQINEPLEVEGSVKLTDNDGDVLNLIDIGGGDFAIPTIPSQVAGTPTIYNITITGGDIGTEKSQVLSNGTNKFLIKYESNGKIEFSFTSGLPTYITIPKGNSYSDADLNLQGETLYFKGYAAGIIQILEWA